MADLQLGIVPEEEAEVPGETKNQRFRRLANQRAGILCGYMRSIGRLVGPSYEASPDEVEKLITHLTKEFNFMVEVLRHGANDDQGDIF
jgi:hypothetical protein